MPITQKPSLLFTPGRACAGPLAVVLHGYSSGLEVLDLDMDRCPRPRPLCSPGCHTSFHYGVDGCIIHQYVAASDTAWGFGITPPTCPAPICPPDPCESCTGLTADQYNPDLSSGVPPVLPVFGVDAQCPGTANCAVIHIALPGQSGFSALDAFGECCRAFQGQYDLDGGCDCGRSKYYRCLVKSLCEIFDALGLVPTVNNLLIHCNELQCLDISELVADILVCQDAPPSVVPLCQCVPTAAQLCAALDTLPTSLVPASSFLGEDCQFHPVVADDITITAVDTACLDLTVVEAPANTFTISGAPIISPTPGNQLVCSPNGLLVPAAVDQTAIVGADTACIDITVVEAPADTFTISAVPIISPDAGNQIECSPNGLLVPAQNVALADSALTLADVIDPTDPFDVYHNSVPANTVSLLAPLPGERNSLYIKNLSADPLVITSVDLIDGVAAITLDGTVPAGYPFGNNGGEAVHLFFSASLATWIVL